MERLSTNAVHADQSLTWERLTAKLPGRLSGHCSVVYNGRLIVIGGYDSDKAAVSNSITEISLVSPHTTKLLATLPQRRRYHGVAIFGDTIVIVGGYECFLGIGALSSVIRYDITKNECQELAPLPYPVCEMATVKWDDDNLIIIGGVGSDRKPLNKVLMYNVKTQKSGMLPDMKYKREGCVAAVVKDTVIVMGGRDESGNVLKSVESFRFDRYSWNELPEMHNERSKATAVVC
jgi:N-acetylneuraminic acid mutarotase